MENKLEFIVAIRCEDGLKTMKVNAENYAAAVEGSELMAAEMKGIVEDILMIY